MTNRIDTIFRELRDNSQNALMPFITAGYPDLPTTAALLPALENAGASICEIGFPFSDPIADGPVIAASMHEALENGFELDALFQTIHGVRDQINLGLVAMVSYSIVHRVGLNAFVNKCAEAGFDGFIFPDLPVEESGLARQTALDAGMTCSLLVAPNSTSDRTQQIAAACTGFVYLMARIGITGERSDTPEIQHMVDLLRHKSNVQTPIACGFGIATAEAVNAVTRHADAAIVGSAIVKRMTALVEQDVTQEHLVQSVASFVHELACGLSQAKSA